MTKIFLSTVDASFAGKYFLLVLLFSLMTVDVGLAQSKTNTFIIGPEVLALKGAKTKKIVELVRRYNEVMFKDPYYKGEFWTNEAKKKYYLPDYMLKQEFSYYTYDSIVANLINVFKPDDYYTAQVAYNLYGNNENKGLICVYTFAIREENDSLKFFPLIETYKFKSYKSPNITFYNNDTIKNEAALLDSLNEYNMRLSKLFQVQPLQFTCYKFKDFAEVNQYIGLDVQKNYSRTENNGYCDAYNKIIFGAFYNLFFHEVVHIYVGDQFLKTYHPWINEGLATYLGGSMDMSLENHLKNLAKDLEKHADYDLNDFLSLDGSFVDQTSRSVFTNYKFTLGGLICKLAYEKGGIAAIKTLLSSGRSGEELYLSVEKVLGVKRKNFNRYFRSEIIKYL
jgi:hypothetical protein